jgi:hypothetical protein
VPGDLRILITRIHDKPVAVVYRYIAPDAPTNNRIRFYSTAGGEIIVDDFHQIAGAEIAIRQQGTGWTLEAAIPWKALGVAPPAIGAKLKGDVGVLLADEHGLQTVERHYWSGKSQTTVSDTPTEARVTPALWGDLYFVEADKSMRFGPEGNEFP